MKTNFYIGYIDKFGCPVKIELLQSIEEHYDMSLGENVILDDHLYVIFSSETDHENAQHNYLVKRIN
jgi:hypothetical protein